MAKPILILVPAYRCESTITETLSSIQQQGPVLEEIREVVIADDGSRDRTAEVARSLWQSATPLRILERQYNCGEYASVNSAVDQFAPDIEWFLIMHADNVAKPGWLQTFLDHIASAPETVGLIGSSYDFFDDSGRTWAGENGQDGTIVTVQGTQEAVADTLKRGCWWHISSCAIRVRAYRKVGGLPKIMQLKGDWDFMLRILADGWTIEHIPKSLMRYRENPVGSSSISFRRHSDIWESMTVIGLFPLDLSPMESFRVHAQYGSYVCRRIVGSVIKLDLQRLLWAFPALGCIGASFYTCLVAPSRKSKSADRAHATQA
jgi:glycosyltransferase involved in cell wall biosynthesis